MKHVAKSVPGVDFCWGDCQVFFVSQSNACNVSSANLVSHNTCTRELPLESAELAELAERQLKIKQHRSQ